MTAGSEGLLLNEEELISAAQLGDLSALAPLITHYQDRLYNLALRMTGTDADAAEATQEAFLRALRSIRKFQAKSSFYTYLVSIMINLINNQRTRHARETRHLAQQAQQMLKTSQAAKMFESQDPSSPIQQQETARIVWQALETLEDQQKQTMILREIEQFSYHRIAAVMKVSQGTVKSRLFRAREALREQLRAFYEQ